MNPSVKSTSGPRRAAANLSVGEYLIRRLGDYGISDIFGIPGDYVLSFYSMLEQSSLRVIGCSREDCAGFAADAYARLNGMGAVCVTYCVGGLSVCNSIAGAFAEKSPVVVISGAPGLRERRRGSMLHHQVRDFRTQIEVFEKFTMAAEELSDPLTAFALIDRTLATADRYKRPVYLELPRDMVHVVPPIAHAYRDDAPFVDPEVIAEAAKETAARLRAAERPVIVAGVEVHRFGLQDDVMALAEKAGIPIAATMLGKSVVSEQHPLYVGLYEGALGHAEVTRFVEESDLILLLGTFMTDINLGVYTAHLDESRCVYATSEGLQISHHHYHDVSLRDFLFALNAMAIERTPRKIPDELIAAKTPRRLVIEEARQAEISRMFQYLDQRLDRETIVIADVGDAMFAATELVTHDRGEFLAPAYYTSMGFAVPAALGATVARPDHRVVALVGDGAFQMTGQEVGGLVRIGASAIVIVIDNAGYGTERYLQEGDWEYNEVPAWAYHRLPEIYGGGKGYDIHTEGEFVAALDTAWNDRTQLHLLHVRIDRNDASRTLRRLAERLGARVAGK